MYRASNISVKEEQNDDIASSITAKANGKSYISHISEGAMAPTKTDFIDYVALFENTLQEIRENRLKNNKASSTTLEARLWYEGLPQNDKEAIDHGVRAITYRGVMNAAKKLYDGAVSEAKRDGRNRAGERNNGGNNLRNQRDRNRESPYDRQHNHPSPRRGDYSFYGMYPPPPPSHNGKFRPGTYGAYGPPPPRFKGDREGYDPQGIRYDNFDDRYSRGRTTHSFEDMYGRRPPAAVGIAQGPDDCRYRNNGKREQNRRRSAGSHSPSNSRMARDHPEAEERPRDNTRGYGASDYYRHGRSIQRSRSLSSSSSSSDSTSCSSGRRSSRRYRRRSRSRSRSRDRHRRRPRDDRDRRRSGRSYSTSPDRSWRSRSRSVNRESGELSRRRRLLPDGKFGKSASRYAEKEIDYAASSTDRVESKDAPVDAKKETDLAPALRFAKERTVQRRSDRKYRRERSRSRSKERKRKRSSHGSEDEDMNSPSSRRSKNRRRRDKKRHESPRRISDKDDCHEEWKRRGGTSSRKKRHRDRHGHDHASTDENSLANDDTHHSRNSIQERGPPERDSQAEGGKIVSLR